MNPATVITHSGQSTSIVHSDSVAARVLQKAMRTGDGKAVGKSSNAAKSVPSQISARGIHATDVTAEPRSQLSETAEKRQQVRARIDETQRGLDDLSFAFEEIGDFRLMSIMSDDATTLAFAANVLGLCSQRASDDAKGNWGDFDSDQELKFEFKIGSANIVIEKHARESVLNVNEKCHVDFFVGAPDLLLAEPIHAYWNEGDLDVHFSTNETLTLLSANKAGSIAMRFEDQTLHLRMPKTPARFGLLDLAV